MKIVCIIRVLLLPLLFCSLGYNLSVAQQGIDLSYNFGSVLVHSPEIRPISHNPVNGFAVYYSFKNRRGEDWRQYFNYPNYGLNYIFKSYNNPDVLGNSHSLTSFIHISFLKRRPVFDIGFKGLAGFGYFTNKYDSIYNPTNLGISANFNITAEVRLYSRIRVKPFYMEYSVGLNHSSNGLVKSPNLGINTLNNSIALGYEFEDQKTNDRKTIKEKPTFIRNEFWTYFTMGYKQTDFDGKSYVFRNLSFNYSKQLSVINKMGVGIDFSNDPSLTAFARYTYHYKGDEDLGFRWAINIHNEFIMGRTGLYGAYGIYLRNSEFYTSMRYYKAGFKFYFDNFYGILLIRAIPLFRAEVVELGVGIRLTDKNYRRNK